MGRDPKHDYHARCIYHITINKAPGCPDFCRISGSPAEARVERSAVGKIVEAHIRNLSRYCGALQLLRYVIMPDHVHFAVFVREPIPRSVGTYIGMMKVRCGQFAREIYPDIGPIFTNGFHDRHLRRSHSLQVILEYIRQNPARWLVREQNPEFFRKINNIEMFGSRWQAYGNMQLLDNPFKGPVVVHRSDSAEVLGAKKRRWKHLSENGGVLVSPFISPAEKEVRRECEEAGGKLIFLATTPFGERQKPGAHDFQLCAEGRLLILAPAEPLEPGRRTFLFLNSIAERIAVSEGGRRI